ncbi:MAG TPA: acyl-CoA thioesterase domain-containing protein [Acidimicrobiales bacterium]
MSTAAPSNEEGAEASPEASEDQVGSLVEVLRLEPQGDGRFVARNHPGSGGGRVVFGGQILAQMVAAAAQAVPDKAVKSLHAIFVRGGELAEPLGISVEVHHQGRLYASATVTVGQAAGLCARALVLLDAADVELARHAEPMPAVDPPPEARAGDADPRTVGEQQIAGGVDLSEEGENGPPELLAWRRFPGAPDEPAISQALLAYASEPLLFGAALRPHAGLSPAMSYREVIPAVITHSVTYHDQFSAADWMLLSVRSPHLGRGRIFGTGDVFSQDGRLIASFTQENQLRPIRPPSA